MSRQSDGLVPVGAGDRRSAAAIASLTTAQQPAAAALLVPSHPRAPTAEDRTAVLAALTSERFVDKRSSLSQRIKPGQLTAHSDRGTSMKS